MSFLSTPLSFISLAPKRGFGSIDVQVVMQESATDSITITKIPVQQGANITDHAYKEPVVFSCTLYFKDNFGVSLSDIYKNLRDLQTSFTPFSIVTPKRYYDNMLLASIGQTTDKNTENVLSVTLSFQEVIIVQVSAVTLQSKNMKAKPKNAPTAPGGKQSAALKAVNALKGLFGK